MNKRRTLTYEGGIPWLHGYVDPFFGLTTDEDITRIYQPDVDVALQWIGFEMAEEFEFNKGFITYVAPSGATQGTYDRGIQVDLSKGGPTATFGTAELQHKGFGRLVHSSEEIPVAGNNIPRWKKQRRYTAPIDGTQHLIDNQFEWELSLGLEVLMSHQFPVAALVGSGGTQGDSPGLREVVSDQYADPVFNSLIVDWKSNPLAMAPDVSGTITIAGNDFTMKGLNFYYIMRNLHTIVEKIMRFARKPLPMNGDVGLILPGDVIQPLVESAVGWVDCGRDITRITSDRASDRLKEVMTGGLGYGHLTSHRGLIMPLVPFDPPDYTGSGSANLMIQDGVCEIYQLIRGSGAQKYINFQYNDLSDGDNIVDGYEATENGRVLVWKNLQHMAMTVNMSTQWRLISLMPQIQIKFINVPCDPLINISQLLHGRVFPSSTA